MMFKYFSGITFLLLVYFPGNAQGPIINNFSPQAAAVGSLITITGNGFDSVAVNNIVYFGHAKATVVSARPDTLLAVVPYGAGYLPISVTVSGLTAFSTNAFTVTFTGQHITAAAFSNQARLSRTGDFPLGMLSADLDNDGKQDIAYVIKWDSLLVVYRNTSEAGNISFAPPVTYNLSTHLYELETADLNGDGKKELLACNYGYNKITILNNSSTLGNIQFTILPAIPLAFSSLGIAVNDLDGDGKPDIVLATYSHRNISVLHNTSSGSNLSYAAAVSYPVAGPPYNVKTEDLNRDGKPDIITHDFNNKSILIFTNNSVPDTVRMNAAITTVLGMGNIIHIETADLDRDGVKEIIALHHASAGSTHLTILKDADTSAVFNFYTDRVINLNSSIDPNSIIAGDINGDSLPELLISDNSNGIAILENSSVPGNISMLEKVRLVSGTHNQDFSYRTLLTDLTNDGQPELVTSFANLDGIGYINISKNAIAGRLCEAGSVTIDAGIAAANAWQWQMDMGSGFVNIGDTANFSGTNTASLLIQQTPSAWYGNKLRCQVQTAGGTRYSNPYILRFGNYFTGAVSNAWEEPGNWSCGSVPGINTDVFINAGLVIINQNTTIRTMVVAAGATVTMATGVTVTVTH